MRLSVGKAIRSEEHIGMFLGVLFLLGLPVLLGWIVLTSKFEGLADPVALEHAQLARHLERGDGYVTSVLRPMTVTAKTSTVPAPDLINAPTHPALLAVVFSFVGASERAVAQTGIICWVVSVWMTFVLALKWWDVRAASLATIFYTCSTGMLLAAGEGLPVPLLAVELLAIMWVLSPAARSQADSAPNLPAWRLVVAGGLCGLAGLTDYLMVSVVVVFGVFLALTAQKKLRAVSLFVLGFLVLWLPWALRNLVVSREGMLGLYSYNALAGISGFPGDSIWSMTAERFHPLLDVVLRPREVMKKIVLGLTHYRLAVGSIFDPMVLFLFTVALFGAPGTSRRGNLARWIMAGVVVGIFWSSFFRPDARMLLAWMPLLGCVGAAQLIAWCEGNIGKIRLGGWRWPGQPKGETTRLYTILPGYTRAAIQLVVAALVVVPMVVYAMRGQNPKGLWADLRPGAAKRILPTSGVVMTDRPAETAWHLDRPALLLCRHEKDIQRLESLTGKIGAFYIATDVYTGLQEGWSDWWEWVTNPRGVYRGFTVVGDSPLPGILRLPKSTDGQTNAVDDELDGLLANVEKNPKSSELHTKLGRWYLAQGRYREAVAAFQDGIALDEYNLDPLTGLWEAQARFRQPEEKLHLAQQVAQASAERPDGQALLERAAGQFDRAMAGNPDPWLIMHAITCRTKLAQWSEVERYHARLTALYPRVFPSQLMSANLFLLQGDLESAEEDCTKQIRAHPEMPTAHELFGRIRLAQGKPADALVEFEKTLRLRPGWLSVRMRAGEACVQLTKYKEAAGHFEAVLKADPENLVVRLSLAEVLLLQNQPEDAVELCREVIDRTPDNRDVLTTLGEILVKADKAAEASVVMERALTLYPLDPEVRTTAGWTYFKANDRDAASLHLREAIRLAPKRGLAHYRLAKVLSADGRNQDALEALRAALGAGLPETEKRDAETLLNRR